MKKLTEAEVLERYVPEPNTGCWLWSGSVVNGYGWVWRSKYAHRYFYEQHIGSIADGLVVDHLCLQKLCVNPEHLEAVTQGVNARRWYGVEEGLCQHGHEKTYRDSYSSPRWVCHTCANTSRRRIRRERAGS